MLLNLFILFIPLSFPSIYLAHKLYRKKFLGSIFNEQIALMMIFTGNQSPNYIISIDSNSYLFRISSSLSLGIGSLQSSGIQSPRLLPLPDYGSRDLLLHALHPGHLDRQLVLHVGRLYHLQVMLCSVRPLLEVYSAGS